MESVTKTAVLRNGKKVLFNRLTLEDLFSISDDLAVEREKIARQLAEEEKIERYEVFNIVLDIRSKKPTVEEILALCSSATTAQAVLRKSLDKNSVPEAELDEIIRNLPIPDCLETARMLILDIQEKKEQPPKNDKTGKSEKTSPVTPSTGKKSKDEKIAELQEKAVASSFQTGTAEDSQ